MSQRVLLGITGGIAAYKTPALVRLLVKAGMEVHVVMTKAATQFVTPLTLATLSGNPVYEDMWGDRHRPQVEHISLADRADVAVIAPATANCIGKIASGIADDMLSTVVMALTCPVLLFPSMNVNMYRNPIVRRNINQLMSVGYHVVDADAGYLACGWTGEGRMPEPEAIVREIERFIKPGDLQGEKILVTGGPTEEPLDPVRFLTNRSSGKMGVALARMAALRGAEVVLVAGPMKVDPPSQVKYVPVRTAQEMHDRCLELFPDMTVVIKSAAVADFRPSFSSRDKIKKKKVGPCIDLVMNPDILHILGKRKTTDQILVGFAAETEDLLKNARKKLKSKNLDLLVLNDVTQPGSGFDCDTNIVRILHRSGLEEQMDIMLKEQVADLILDRISELRRSCRPASVSQPEIKPEPRTS